MGESVSAMQMHRRRSRNRGSGSDGENSDCLDVLRIYCMYLVILHTDRVIMPSYLA